MRTLSSSTRSVLAVVGAAALTLTLSACSGDDDTAGTIGISDAYVKSASMEPMDMGTDQSMDMGTDSMEMELMSAAFMVIANGTDDEVRLVGGSTPAADRVEIHEVVDGVMQPIEGGLVIAAGESSTLEPGGNHVMLMGLTQDLTAGDEVELTLEFSNGDSIDVTAPVKDVAAGDEPYATSTPKA
jgi:hypothetical protein